MQVNQTRTSGTLELSNHTVDAGDHGTKLVVDAAAKLVLIHCTNDRLLQTAQREKLMEMKWVEGRKTWIRPR